MIRAIIFDFDGVLVESVDIKTRAFAELFRAEGGSVVKKVIAYHLLNTGVSRFEKFVYIYKNILKRRLNRQVYRDLCDRFSRLAAEKVIEAPYVLGAREFLDSQSAVYDCFVVSATPQDEIREIVKKRKMEHYFKAVYGAPCAKAAAVAKILRERRLLPGEIVYVGDALGDYKAARANKIRFIARKTPGDLFEGIDCPKIDDLSDLKKTIPSL